MTTATNNKPTMIALPLIQIDGGTQSRACLNQRTIEDYADDMRDGAIFPPVTVFFDGLRYWLADGFHRWHAARKADREKLSCDVKQGTQRDAILYSVGANRGHGERRTNADKRRAVELLLGDGEWGKKSPRWIAEKCGVSHTFVKSMQTQVETVSTSTVAGRDGKHYPRHRPVPSATPKATYPPTSTEPAEPRPSMNGISKKPEIHVAESFQQRERPRHEPDEPAPVTPIPQATRRRPSEAKLTPFGQIAQQIESQVEELIQQCAGHVPEERKALNFGEGVKKLRFARRLLSDAKSMI